MHILFIGYGKTSRRIAKQLFQQGHQITTVSRSTKDDDFAQHLIQNVHQLDLSQIQPIDVVYVLLSPSQSTPLAYQQTYLDSVAPIVTALKDHPIQKIIVVSSTRVYGQNSGERVDDASVIQPRDEQGDVLWQMEQQWQQAYPTQSIIVRPTGIYGTSAERMVRLAETTQSYPNIYWSNRIHIDDLAHFLAYLSELEHAATSYIVSNNQPMPLHETIVWFQRQLNLPELTLLSQQPSGRQIFATRMLQTGFELQHQDCFADYAALLH